MTQEDIIRMAEACGIPEFENNESQADNIMRFAALVAAAEQKKWEDQTEVEIHEAVLDEREACAKVCDEESMEERDDWANGWLAKAWDCARAIRARSDK